MWFLRGGWHGWERGSEEMIWDDITVGGTAKVAGGEAPQQPGGSNVRPYQS